MPYILAYLLTSNVLYYNMIFSTKSVLYFIILLNSECYIFSFTFYWDYLMFHIYRCRPVFIWPLVSLVEKHLSGRSVSTLQWPRTMVSISVGRGLLYLCSHQSFSYSAHKLDRHGVSFRFPISTTFYWELKRTKHVLSSFINF